MDIYLIVAGVVLWIVVGIYAVRAFMRGAKAEGIRRRLEREAADEAARAACRRLQARWQSRARWEGGGDDAA